MSGYRERIESPWGVPLNIPAGTWSGKACTCYAFILSGGRVERRYLHCPIHGQSVSSVGRPYSMHELGARLVDEHEHDLRRLADA